MASLGDSEKRQAWTARFARYQASGLSVARFCAQERVSVNTFYRWAKLVGSNSARPSTSTGKPPQRGRLCVQPAAAAGRIAQSAVVRFSWNAGVEVSVPADCLEVIRCLAECLQRTRPECSDAFQEVVVRS
jgi:hypothetical protein